MKIENTCGFLNKKYYIGRYTDLEDCGQNGHYFLKRNIDSGLKNISIVTESEQNFLVCQRAIKIFKKIA